MPSSRQRSSSAFIAASLASSPLMAVAPAVKRSGGLAAFASFTNASASSSGSPGCLPLRCSKLARMAPRRSA